MTLLHHEQTVTLADLATTKAGIRSEVRELARDLRAIEEPDIAVLRAWLIEWNAPERLNVHSGHPMKGILLDVEMAGMEALGRRRLRERLAGADDRSPGRCCRVRRVGGAADRRRPGPDDGPQGDPDHARPGRPAAGPAVTSSAATPLR
jgi:hypothetical protein